MIRPLCLRTVAIPKSALPDFSVVLGWDFRELKLPTLPLLICYISAPELIFVSCGLGELSGLVLGFGSAK